MTKSRILSGTQKPTTPKRLPSAPGAPPPIDSLSVRNYQSIADSGDLRLGNLTVIVGANDSGKTALQRALVALAFNQTGHDFVRWGQEAEGVEVVVQIGGARVTWVKGETATYRLALPDMPAREFTKLGAAVPEPVEELLALRTIEIDAITRLRPQFQMEHDTPFLLDETATKAARVLAKNSRLDILVLALAAQKKHLRDIEKRLDTDTAQQERLQERRNEFPDVAAAHARVLVARDMVIQAEATITNLYAIQEYQLAKARARALQAQVGRLPDVDNLVAWLDRLASAYNRHEDAVRGQETASERLRQAEDAEALALVDLRKFAETIDICPVCGQPVDAATLLEHED